MKKIVITLLALITLLACISCDKSNDTPEQTDDTPPYQEMFLSYDDIIDTLLDMSKNGCLDLYENRSALFSERESKIYSELRNLADTTYGSVCYTIRDVNKDGTDELIFTSADPYHMLNLLTLKDNKPVMLDFFWSGTNNHVGSIDENGVVYKEAYGKGDNYHYYIKEIIAGELVGLEFGVLDRDIDDAEVEYYKDENGTYTVIPESEFYEIREQYDHVFSKRYASNYILGLGPYTKLIEASPDYKIIDYGEDDNGNQKIICEFYDENGNLVNEKVLNEHIYVLKNGSSLAIGSAYDSIDFFFYDPQSNTFSEYFEHTCDYSEDKVAYIKDNKLIIQNIFDSTVFYEEYPEISSYIRAHFSPDGKSFEINYKIEGEPKPATKAICFEDLPIIVTEKLCYVRSSPSIYDDNVIYLSSSNPAYMRPATKDTARLVKAEAIEGGEYPSDNGTRNDWYEIIYHGRICYVTADSFFVSTYNAEHGIN